MPLRQQALPRHHAVGQALSRMAAGAPTLHWGAEALWERLEPLLPGLSVEVAASVPSTNTRLLELARQGDAQPALLVAETQTAGRGRLGREWVAVPGASLTFSLALPYAPADWSGLSLAVGLALAEALDPGPAEPRIWLKWPNDLWLREGAGGVGRKLGGILIETVAVGENRLAVIGIGLNVRPEATAAVAGLAGRTACLAELDPAASAPAALASVAEPLVRALLRFGDAGFAPLVPAYARRDGLAGQRVTTTLAQAPEGVAEGVDATGALRVRGASLQAVSSGEVSVRLAEGSPA